jgi:DNA replication protein DnaC
LKTLGQTLNSGNETLETSDEQYMQMQVDWYNNTKYKSTNGIDCNKCHNKGDVEYIKNGHIYLRDCECKGGRIAAKRYEEAKSTPTGALTFENYTTNNPHHKRFKQKAIEYTQNFKDTWFFIGGQFGSGKTHLCSAISLEITLNYGVVDKMYWVEDVNDIKGSFDNRYDKMQLFKSSKILFIDDFMKGGASEADIRIAFELLDYRYSRKLPTIISSEYTSAELRQIDGAIYSRVEQMSYGYNFSISKDDGKNMRVRS